MSNTIIFSLLTFVLWAIADLFYKRAAKKEDKYSHLKTTIFVGIAMGIIALYYLIVLKSDFTFMDFVKYLPISFFYISSMMIGYYGLRYISLSITSPVENTSGILVPILMFVFFGRGLQPIQIFSIILIFIGMYFVALFQEDNKVTFKKLNFSLAAIAFPIAYCVLDGIGTFIDCIYLDEMNLISEEASIIAYGFTFLAIAIALIIYLKAKHEKIGFTKNPNGLIAATFESLGQIAYVYAITDDSPIAVTIVGAYCVGSVILGRLFLKEKLSWKEYLSIGIVILGIILLCVADSIEG